MPETASLTVSEPLLRLTLPLDSTRPLLRLIEPPEVGAIVPWQSTGSLIEPQPLTRLAGGHVERGAARVNHRPCP